MKKNEETLLESLLASSQTDKDLEIAKKKICLRKISFTNRCQIRSPMRALFISLFCFANQKGLSRQGLHKPQKLALMCSRSKLRSHSIAPLYFGSARRRRIWAIGKVLNEQTYLAKSSLFVLNFAHGVKSLPPRIRNARNFACDSSRHFLLDEKPYGFSLAFHSRSKFSNDLFCRLNLQNICSAQSNLAPQV